jgi:hypothetical protein
VIPMYNPDGAEANITGRLPAGPDDSGLGDSAGKE